MIGTYIGIGFMGVVTLIGLLILIVGIATRGGAAMISTGIIMTIIAAAIGVALFWWLHNTAEGARAVKDFQSNIHNGIERTVTVYDINGEIIKEYSGKFDVETREDSIRFDDENGKRHIIYYTTGTVIVDEK